MLWSMQLELPDSPGVVKRLTSERRLRMRSTSLMKRESYSSRCVNTAVFRSRIFSKGHSLQNMLFQAPDIVLPTTALVDLDLIFLSR